MPKFVIEREMPGLGAMTSEMIKDCCRQSSLMMRELGGEITWVTSYITGDKMYCVFIAPSEDVILEHARCLDLPADRICRVVVAVDATTGE